MSCGSINYTSIPSDISISKPFSGFEWFRQRLSGWLAEIGSERSYQLRQLHDLDDRLLADIGLSRAQLASGARKSSRVYPAMRQIHR